tara:strand:- start:1739 stop:2029 length:291 start_codon:yes stop_codon:yes gene_type:complete
VIIRIVFRGLIRYDAGMTIELFRDFLGWCTVINSGLLILSSIMLIVMKGAVSSMHARMFGIDEESVKAVYFKYLGYYKLLILVFNLAPYLALRIVA